MPQALRGNASVVEGERDAPLPPATLLTRAGWGKHDYDDSVSGMALPHPSPRGGSM